MVMERAGLRDAPGAIWRLFREGHSLAEHPRARSFPRVGEARVTALERDGEPVPFPLEVDGDYLGEHTEAVYGVATGALRVIA
jgi:hypothetical protein